MMLFSSANSGARGKDATNRVTKPNWMTAERGSHQPPTREGVPTAREPRELTTGVLAGALPPEEGDRGCDS